MLKRFLLTSSLVVLSAAAWGCARSSHAKFVPAPEGDPLRTRMKTAIETCIKGDATNTESEGTAMWNDAWKKRDRRIMATFTDLCSSDSGYILSGGVEGLGGPCCQKFLDGAKAANKAANEAVQN